jgi:hypothetical protein
MSMATRTDTQSPALHVADSHDLIRVQGARENYPIILRSARGAHRYSPKCPERLSEKGYEQRSGRGFGRYTEAEK